MYNYVLIVPLHTKSTNTRKNSKALEKTFGIGAKMSDCQLPQMNESYDNLNSLFSILIDFNL